MTTPTTPGDAIARAAARHKASTDATKALAERLTEERRTAPDGELPATATPTP